MVKTFSFENHCTVEPLYGREGRGGRKGRGRGIQVPAAMSFQSVVSLTDRYSSVCFLASTTLLSGVLATLAALRVWRKERWSLKIIVQWNPSTLSSASRVERFHCVWSALPAVYNSFIVYISRKDIHSFLPALPCPGTLDHIRDAKPPSYRIILQTSSSDYSYVVSVASTRQEIARDWQWLQENLLETLCGWS